MVKFLLILTMLIASAACIAPGPIFNGWEKLPTGKGLIYVYRKPNFQIDMIYTVKVDGEEVGPVYHGAYLTVPIMPGAHQVQVYEATYLAPATQPVTLNVSMGEIYPLNMTSQAFASITADRT